MDNGGAVYMEGANAGYSHNGTEFFEHFGTTFLNIGSQNAISTLSGIDGTFTNGTSFGYPTGDPNYNIDQLAADEGIEIIHSQDNICRGVMYDAGDWRTIICSPILGCYNPSEMFSTRKYFMMEYVAFLADIEGPELFVEETEIVFDPAGPGEDVEAVLHVQNTGFMPLEIWQINLEGDAFLADVSGPVAIEGQQYFDITLTFRSMQTGNYNGYLEFVSNDRDHENEVITLTGTCTYPAEMGLSVNEYDLDIYANEVSEEELIISNTGEGTLNYEIMASADWITSNIDEGSLAQDEETVVTFTFSAEGLAPNDYNAEIIISSNDPENSQVFIPVSLTVLPSVDGNENDIPGYTGFNSVYPNPFNPRTAFSYSLSENAEVKITIYNVLGRKVTELVNKTQSAGNYVEHWEPKNQTSGVYFYNFQAGDVRSTGKIMLIK